jgi:hypothetical protein
MNNIPCVIAKFSDTLRFTYEGCCCKCLKINDNTFEPLDFKQFKLKSKINNENYKIFPLQKGIDCQTKVFEKIILDWFCNEKSPLP